MPEPRTTDLQREIEQFLYHEAQLLDDERFHEWLDLLADDLVYVIPLRESVQGGASQFVDPDGGELGFVLMDEDKTSMALRIARLDTGMAYAELPPSVTKRLITNVRVAPAEDGDGLSIDSNFACLQLRLRADRSETIFFGSRRDRLRKVSGSWMIAAREVRLAQPILDRTLSILF